MASTRPMRWRKTMLDVVRSGRAVPKGRTGLLAYPDSASTAGSKNRDGEEVDCDTRQASSDLSFLITQEFKPRTGAHGDLDLLICQDGPPLQVYPEVAAICELFDFGKQPAWGRHQHQLPSALVQKVYHAGNKYISCQSGPSDPLSWRFLPCGSRMTSRTFRCRRILHLKKLNRPVPSSYRGCRCEMIAKNVCNL